MGKFMHNVRLAPVKGSRLDWCWHDEASILMCGWSKPVLLWHRLIKHQRPESSAYFQLIWRDTSGCECLCMGTQRFGQPNRDCWNTLQGRLVCVGAKRHPYFWRPCLGWVLLLSCVVHWEQFQAASHTGSKGRKTWRLTKPRRNVPANSSSAKE